MIYVLFLILILVVFKSIDLSIKLEGPVKFIILFILFAFIYYMGVLFETTFRGTSVGAYDVIISDRVKFIIISLGILSIVGFVGGFLLSDFRLTINMSQINFRGALFLSVVFLATFSGLVLFIFYYDSIINSTSSYIGNYTETYNNPLYAYLKEIFTYNLAILICFLSMGNRKLRLLAFLPTLILIIFGLLSSDKDPVLLAILGWGIYFYYELLYKGLNKIATYFLILITGAIIIPLFSMFFSMFRADLIDQSWDQIEKNGLYTYFDASGPLESLVYSLEDPNLQFEYGKTYYWGFISWIPKNIWASRPIDLAEKYAKETISDWEPGKGKGYSLLTEAYKNFGIAGALIQYFLIGLIIGVSGKIFYWIFNNKSEAGFVFFIWLSYNIVIMHRGPFNIPSSLIRFILPFIFSYYGIQFLSNFYLKIRTKNIHENSLGA